MRFLWTGCILIFLFSCEKNIDIKLKDSEPKLVVEATIENGEPPRVILTNTVGYFSKISPQILAQSFVRNAEVYVSNGTLIHKLKEYAIPLGGGFNFYYYSIDSSNLATAFAGQLNKQYSLRILANGEEYTATTTIPNINRRVDSIWWKPLPAPEDSVKAAVMIRAYDPPGYGDYIRYLTSTNDGPFFAPEASVYDDLFIDGTNYEVQIQPGFDRNADSTERNFFRRGDTVTFKLSNIDKATYDFWRTWEYSYSSIGNPFSTPTKILSNIKGNALGYFGGYATQYRTLIIPR
jgi:hypothetical protein